MDTGLKFYNLVDSAGFCIWLFLQGDDGQGIECNNEVTTVVNQLLKCIDYPYIHIVVMDPYYGGLPTAELVHEKGMFFLIWCLKERLRDSSSLKSTKT